MRSEGLLFFGRMSLYAPLWRNSYLPESSDFKMRHMLHNDLKEENDFKYCF